MLEIVIEGILTNHNEITNISKKLKTINTIVGVGVLGSLFILYDSNKKIKKQNTQISELKKELEEIKTKGE